MAWPSTLKLRAVLAVLGVAVSLAPAALHAQAPGGAGSAARQSPAATRKAPSAPAPATQPTAAPATKPTEANPAEAAAPAEAKPAEAAAPDPELDAASEVAPEAEPDFETPEPTLTSKEATDASKQRLQQRLRELQADREGTTNLLPWITISTGLAVVAVSATVGALNAFDCDREVGCTAPPWASLGVVAGAAVAVAGTLWLVRTDADIRELEMQQNQLKLDIERLEHARWKRSGLAQRGSPQVSVRFAF